jgi:hypothetical protein
VTNVYFSLSSEAIFICLYLDKPSMKEYVVLRTTLLTKTSICGKEKLSLWLALFKSLKFTQTLIFPSFLSTTTMLDTHCGYLTTSKKLVFYCFLNSILTLIKISGWVFLNFYLTDLQPSTSGTCILQYLYLN